MDVLTWTIERRMRLTERAELLRKELAEIDAELGRLDEALLSQRQEKRVTLLVNPALSDGRLKAVYEAWGTKQIGRRQPFGDSPVFARCCGARCSRSRSRYPEHGNASARSSGWWPGQASWA